MRRLLLAAIRAYQRYLSPYKGFCCAYRLHTGRASCSNIGYRAVRRYGSISGLALIRQRTRLCGITNRRYSVGNQAILNPQRGVCDAGCDAPCAPDCNFSGGFSNALSFLDCCNCSCDWPSRNKRDFREKEKFVYIPPNINCANQPGKRPRA